MIVENHEFKNIPFIRSPNTGVGISPKYLIIHHSGGHHAAAAINYCRSPQSKSSSHLFIDQTGAITQMVKFDKEVAGYIKERIWHPSQKIKQNKDGTITATYNVAGTKEIKYWVLSYGQHAEVVEPKSLRDEIKKDLSLALKRY